MRMMDQDVAGLRPKLFVNHWLCDDSVIPKISLKNVVEVQGKDFTHLTPTTMRYKRANARQCSILSYSIEIQPHCLVQRRLYHCVKLFETPSRVQNPILEILGLLGIVRPCRNTPALH